MSVVMLCVDNKPKPSNRLAETRKYLKRLLSRLSQAPVCNSGALGKKILLDQSGFWAPRAGVQSQHGVAFLLSAAWLVMYLRLDTS